MPLFMVKKSLNGYEMIEVKEFASVSHAVTKALVKLKQEYESGKGK